MSWGFTDYYTGDRFYEGFDLDKLSIDKFYLNITSDDVPEDELFLYSLNKECIECPYLFRDKANGNIFSTNTKFRIATTQTEYFPQNETSNVICDFDNDFGQFGIYKTNVHQNRCTTTTIKEPVNIYAPILSVIFIYLLLFGAVYGSYFIYKKWIRKTKLAVSNPKEQERSGTKKERVMSLDTFRGISIVIMIFVNFGAGGYNFLEHTVWNGLNVADVVFPWFLWIMGACIPISLSSSFKKNVSNKSVLLNVTKRSIKLFLLGIFLNSGCGFNYMRIFGVLQRFGISYFVVTVTCLYLTKRDVNFENGALKWFADIVKMTYCWVVALIILTVHTLIFFLASKPGCPRGYFGPGGLHKNRQYQDCAGGITGHIDTVVLGNHQWQYPTIYEVYESRPFEPEGILGCLTTIFQVFLGVQAGTILLTYKKHGDRIFRWLAWASVTGIIGGALCGFSKEDGVIPLNKNIWSLSFMMVTSCFAFALLTFCYLVIDVQKWWTGKPFLFAGMNAILMYIGHEMTDGHFPVRWWYGDDENGEWRNAHFIALLSDSWGAIFWVLVSYYLYKIKYFFTI